jgi:hypothetical protein
MAGRQNCSSGCQTGLETALEQLRWLSPAWRNDCRINTARNLIDDSRVVQRNNVYAIMTDSPQLFGLCQI